MANMDWMFDVLFELSEYADREGYVQLSEALEHSMDAYCADETLLDRRARERDAIAKQQIGWGIAAQYEMAAKAGALPRVKEVSRV